LTGNNDPAATVVIPCYNQGEFLFDCIKSVREQTFASWEAVIVDDGSDDDTAAAVQKVAGRPPVKAIRTPNRGLPHARNEGAQRSLGPFIVFLDADDMLAPKALEQMKNALDRCPQAAYCYGATELVGKLHGIWPHRRYNFFNLLFKNQSQTTVMIRRGAFESSGGFRFVGAGQGYEDWDMWIRLGGAGFHGVHVPSPLFRYRIKERSMISDAAAHHAQLLRALRERNSALYEPVVLLAAKRRWSPGVSIVAPQIGPEAIREIEKRFLDFEIVDSDGLAIHPSPAPDASLRPEAPMGRLVVQWNGMNGEEFVNNLLSKIASEPIHPQWTETVSRFAQTDDPAVLSILGERLMRMTQPVWISASPPSAPDEIGGDEARLRSVEEMIRKAGHRRVAWFGAGAFAKKLMAMARTKPAVIFDDDAKADYLNGVSVKKPGADDLQHAEAVLIATDAQFHTLLRRALSLLQGRADKILPMVF